MSDHPTPLGGTCIARFDPLRELFAAKIESGEDLDGEMVVDLWGGWADEARTVPWTENTIACVFSTTKTMTALAALVLVDRGELDLDANVAAYWPEFAARGKAGIKVRQLLSHTSGVSGWDQPVTIEDLYDWDKSTAKLAAQSPWWEPGAGSGYHGMTYGHLIGEVIRRITGQRLGEFFAAQIAGPLGADFHIGLPHSEFPRVANMVPPPSHPDDLTQLDPNSVEFKTKTGPAIQAEWSWTEGWRRADIGAGNGHGNARSVARLQSPVACGGEVDGVRLLAPKTIDRIFEVQSHTVDLVMGIPIKFGIGYDRIFEVQSHTVDLVMGIPIKFGIGYGLLPMPHVLPFLPEGRLCAWGGWGGSLVIADVDRRMTVAYVMNKMASGTPGPIVEALVERVYDIVKR